MPQTFDIKKLTELYATQENPLYIFLLVDGAAHEGTILKQVYEYGSPLEHAPLYQGTAHEEDQLLGPHLIRIHENSPQLHWFMEKATDAGLLILSDKGTEQLAAYLKSWLECILPDDSRKLFRFYDPLIF